MLYHVVVDACKTGCLNPCAGVPLVPLRNYTIQLRRSMMYYSWSYSLSSLSNSLIGWVVRGSGLNSDQGGVLFFYTSRLTWICFDGIGPACTNIAKCLTSQDNHLPSFKSRISTSCQLRSCVGVDDPLYKASSIGPVFSPGSNDFPRILRRIGQAVYYVKVGG